MQLTRSQLGRRSLELRGAKPWTSPHPPSRPAVMPRPANTPGPQRSAEPMAARASRTRPAAAGPRKPVTLATLGFQEDAFLAIGSDGRYAVSRSQAQTKASGPQPPLEDPDTRIWDLKAKRVIWQGDLGAFTATSVAVDPAAGRYVFCDSRSLLVWPMDEELQRPFTINHGGSGSDKARDSLVAVSADGLYAVSFGNTKVKVWDLEQRRCIGSEYNSCEGRPQGVCVSADQRYAAVTQSEPGVLQIVDFDSGSASSRVAELPGRYDWAAFTITADRRYAISTAADVRQGLQLWDLKPWYSRHEGGVRPVATLHGHVGPLRAVAVAADRRIVTITGDGGSDDELCVWDARPWWQRILSMS